MRAGAKIIIFSLLLFWMMGIVSGIIVSAQNVHLLPVTKTIYSAVCHQQMHKTIFFNEIPLMVCARCSGIYTGGLVAAFILLFMKKDVHPSIRYLFIAALPILIDILLYSSGIYIYNKIISFSSGFLFGSVVLFYIYKGVIDFFVEQKLKRKLL